MTQLVKVKKNKFEKKTIPNISHKRNIKWFEHINQPLTLPLVRWDTMIVVQFLRTPSFSMQVSQRPLVTFRVPASSSHCVHSFPAMAIIASNAQKKKSREVSKFLLKQLTCSTWCTNYVLLVQWIMNLFKFVYYHTVIAI